MVYLQFFHQAASQRMPFEDLQTMTAVKNALATQHLLAFVRRSALCAVA
jgi:arylamine N-acetyltransferase